MVVPTRREERGLPPDDGASPTRARRAELVGVATWMAVVAAGVAAVLATGDLASISIQAPPLHATWDPRITFGVVPAAVAASLAVLVLPGWCRRRSWRGVTIGSMLAALGWGVALALDDGWQGLVGPAQNRHEYLAGVARIGSPVDFLQHFPSEIARFPVHVQGHPPGYPLLVWAIERLGLGAWGVTALQCAGAMLVVPAVLVAVREVAGESFARRAAPFVAVSPAAIWMVSSADAWFAAVGAWGVALVVLATRPERRHRTTLAFGGGVLLGVSAFLSYGLVLLAIIPLGVAWRRRGVRAIACAATGGLTVFALFAGAGFWWFSGLAATHARYVGGIASRRPYEVFAIANLAALAIVVGPAVAAGIARLRDARVGLLVGGAVVAILLADVSGMSKGEVERIWLPFAVWLLPAAGALATKAGDGPARRWLAAQCGLAVAVQVCVRTPW